MQLNRKYDRTRFSPEVLREAVATLFAGLDGEPRNSLTIAVDDGEWTHDSEEEFFADYRRSLGMASLRKDLSGYGLRVYSNYGSTDIGVTAPTRARIHETFEVFERNLDNSRLPEPSRPTQEAEPPVVIFIGHGANPAWRDLKDHLQDKHGFTVEAYEIGARAGHTIRDILEDMLQKSSFAVLVMTGEDETVKGGVRARQNVIHEAGLFQGQLGFNRAIILLEEGTDEFSNIQGIQQIRFARGNIKEAFGDVLATLRREFERGGS